MTSNDVFRVSLRLPVEDGQKVAELAKKKRTSNAQVCVELIGKALDAGIVT